MIVGFTGTQQGMTREQKRAVETFLGSIEGPFSVRHGDCIGADEEFAALVRFLYPDVSVVSHPPTDPRKRAFTEADAEFDPEPYLERDHAIVDACSVLIACPKGWKEERRSGTWATVRYARREGKEVVMFTPDGERVSP